MHIALWILQVLLAAVFLMAGGSKLALPPEQLIANGMAFVKDSPLLLVRFIGLAEVAGALGLLLPSALRIQPKLTPIASALLGVVMVLALGTHVVRGEMGGLGGPIILGSLCAFVAWGRWSKQPIEPK